MFTVKQLARLAGVTPRTLHYYDEIGLLKPSQVGDNGYRYYEEEQMLRLQQILYYRELDLPLEEIGKIMGRRDFELVPALESHKTELRKRMRQIEKLIETVDDTILHLKGIKPMKQKEFFEPFSPEQEEAYTQEAMQHYDPATVKAANQKWKHYSPAEKERILAEGNAVYLDFVKAMPLGPASGEAQACVERWRANISAFWTPDLEQMRGLAEGYNNDPRFKANFDKIHPDLAEFIRAAVEVYVKANLPLPPP